MEIKRIDREQFLEYVEWIEIFDAMEIHRLDQGGKTDLLIPYLMNDTVESILRIHDCVFSSEISDFQDAIFLDIEGSDDLVLEKEDQIIAIRYESLSLETTCYQYHNIGHNWRKMPGEEQLRRLVNIVCAVYDKYRYLGEEYSNESEREIAALIEFGPFAEWSPINSSMLEWYSETEQGIEAMKALVHDAGDEDYYSLLCEYEKKSLRSTSRKMDYQILTGNLAAVEHIGIYECLLEKIMRASMMWESRDYGKAQNEWIQGYRDHVMKIYQEEGYDGEYPYLTCYDSQENMWKMVHFVEQHPFTILESKRFTFKIFAMESSIKEDLADMSKKKNLWKDYGFFHNSLGNSRFIELPAEKIEDRYRR